jgi:hypothetical protein
MLYTVLSYKQGLACNRGDCGLILFLRAFFDLFEPEIELLKGLVAYFLDALERQGVILISRYCALIKYSFKAMCAETKKPLVSHFYDLRLLCV